MKVIQFLENHSEEVIGSAVEATRRAGLGHYNADGAVRTHHRLELLYSLTKQCLRTSDAESMIRHAGDVAMERFYSGHDLREVLMSFNVLEEAIWCEVLENMAPDQYAEAMGKVSTVLNLGKDSLARTYVSLASKEKVATLDLKQLFKGVEWSGIPELI